jgi:hypothetical protein
LHRSAVASLHRHAVAPLRRCVIALLPVRRHAGCQCVVVPVRPSMCVSESRSGSVGSS